MEQVRNGLNVFSAVWIVLVGVVLAAGLAAAAPWDVEPVFKDEYTSDRLRYQVWTWRPSVDH